MVSRTGGYATAADSTLCGAAVRILRNVGKCALRIPGRAVIKRKAAAIPGIGIPSICCLHLFFVPSPPALIFFMKLGERFDLGLDFLKLGFLLSDEFQKLFNGHGLSCLLHGRSPWQGLEIVNTAAGLRTCLAGATPVRVVTPKASCQDSPAVAMSKYKRLNSARVLMRFSQQPLVGNGTTLSDKLSSLRFNDMQLE